MRRCPPLRAGLGALVAAAVATTGPVAGASARVTLIDDTPDVVARALAAQPGGGPGLMAAYDDVYQVVDGAPLVARTRVAARIAGAPADGPGPWLAGRDATGMADLLAELARTAPARRVVVDAIGPSFRGADGDALAAAMRLLAGRRPAWAPTGVARRVHLHATDAAALLTDPAYAGARAAMVRAGAVWLRTTSPGAEWTPAQWLTWPSETARRIAAAGGHATRVHLTFARPGDQGAAWERARTGSACRILATGAGAYRLGSEIGAFVAQYRSSFVDPSSSKRPAIGCTAAPALTESAARGLDGARAAEATGVALPPGGIITPPLPAGEAAQVTVGLGADPLGLAAAFGVPPGAFWSDARARLLVSGPGVALDVLVEGDGAARLDFTPTAPGPVAMSLVVEGAAVTRLLGAPADVAGPLAAVGAGALVDRVTADPDGWRLTIPVVPTGGALGDPVLEIVPPVA